MGNTSPWAATNRRASLISLDKLQAASRKQQAASFKLRQSVIYASGAGMVTCSSQTTKGERYESYNRSRMEMAGRTGPSFGRRSYEGPEGGWIRSRKDLHSGTSPGGQTKNKIQRRGPAATRRGSVSGFPHLRKNVIITAPAQAGVCDKLSRVTMPHRHKRQAASVKQQASSCDILSRVTMCQEIQASSGKRQARSSKRQASSRSR